MGGELAGRRAGTSRESSRSTTPSTSTCSGGPTPRSPPATTSRTQPGRRSGRPRSTPNTPVATAARSARSRESLTPSSARARPPHTADQPRRTRHHSHLRRLENDHRRRHQRSRLGRRALSHLGHHGGWPRPARGPLGSRPPRADRPVRNVPTPTLPDAGPPGRNGCLVRAESRKPGPAAVHCLRLNDLPQLRTECMAM